MGSVRFVVIARLTSRLMFRSSFVSLRLSVRSDACTWRLIAVVNDDGISTVDCNTNEKQLHVSMHDDMTLYMTISSSSRFDVLH